MKNVLGSKIKERREELDMSQEELAKALGYRSRSTIARIENGTNDITQSKIVAFAKALKCSPSYLMGWEDEDIMEIPTTKVPLLGTIAAGEPILAMEHIEEYIALDTFTKADFCLRVKGDSMIGANIQDGDIVFIRIQNDVEDGEIAAILIDDSATLKRVFKFGDHVQLRAENPNIKPIVLNGDKSAKILGKAVYRITKI